MLDDIIRVIVEKRVKKWKIAIYSLALLATFVYIVYRVIWTVPYNLRPVDLIFGLIVLFVELIEALEFYIYYRNNLRVSTKEPKLPKIDEWPEVDVLVATYDEDVAVLEKTLSACKKMTYAGKYRIFLCDDGKRDEMRKLARKMRVEYITRSNNRFAKAGNYNHALKETRAPLVATFDADMQPTKDFLIRTVPYFTDEKVGFVQTPQSFNNPDIFQARLGSAMPFEQDFFYHHIQMARAEINSTILCGTNCVISRKSLKAAGGFAQATIAEDVATGMLIEAKGYRGIALTRVLAHGESVETVAGFLRQRSRWGRGCIQTAKAYGIFRLPGLSMRQKLDYFAAINYWCFGIKRMFYMILPLLFAYFGVIAIRGNLVIFAIVFFSQYLLKRFAIDRLEGSHKSSTWIKIYEIIQAPFMAIAVLGELVGFSSKRFKVTQKGSAGRKTLADWLLFAGHFALFGANAFGITLALHWIRNGQAEVFIIPFIWMVVNAFYLLVALVFDLRGSRHYCNFRPNRVKKYSPKSYLGIIWRGSK